jgi:hypothetical protein
VAAAEWFQFPGDGLRLTNLSLNERFDHGRPSLKMLFIIQHMSLKLPYTVCTQSFQGTRGKAYFAMGKRNQTKERVNFVYPLILLLLRQSQQ